MNATGFIQMNNSRFASQEIPCDLIVKIHTSTFHVHKFPFLAKCGKIRKLLMVGEEAMAEEGILNMDDMPGGDETFEVVSMFCYSHPVDLTPSNIASLRCAAEYLEMTEDVCHGNLISKAESYFTMMILSSWMNSLAVLRSLNTFCTMAEHLHLVRRCIESLAWKVTSPMYMERNGSNSLWWVQDVCDLTVSHFVKMIKLVESNTIYKDSMDEILGFAIMEYGYQWLPELSNNVEKSLFVMGDSIFNDTQHCHSSKKEIVESIIRLLTSTSTRGHFRPKVTCSFAFRLLKQGIVLQLSEKLLCSIENTVASILEQASLQDLLIPNVRSHSSYLYDVYTVKRIVDYYLQIQFHNEKTRPSPKNVRAVVKLIDSYLCRVARDANLSVDAFLSIAEALPQSIRVCHDGMYRAVDIYLKAHSNTTKQQRKKLCRVMDCYKLSKDARLHASRNERLPVRTIMKIVFFDNELKSSVDVNAECKCQTHLEEDRTEKIFVKKNVDSETESLRVEIAEMRQEIRNMWLEIQSKEKNDRERESSSESAWMSRWKKKFIGSSRCSSNGSGNIVDRPVLKERSPPQAPEHRVSLSSPELLEPRRTRFSIS